MTVDRGHLLTEQPNPRSHALDTLSVDQAFDVMHAEDATLADAVNAARGPIIGAVTQIAERLRTGGRLFYVGAGTSGRLGVLDAAECPPTFLTDPSLVQGVIAGGEAALQRAVEGAEDDPIAARRDLAARGLAAGDVVFGITAGGTTPYVHAALDYGRELGALTVFLACVPRAQVDDRADISIRVLTGPEVISGSTRLKAGLATKMVLNRISTLVMVQLGKVFGNLMVDVNARANAKLVDRAIRTLAAATALDRAAASALLDRADWHVKTALLMQARGLDAQAARARLAAANGSLRAALGEPAPPPAEGR